MSITRYTHYEKLRLTLQFALKSGNEGAIEVAVRQIVLAELCDIEVGADAENVRSGSHLMRKAACSVYANNLSHETVGDRCADYLQTFFNDEDAEVRSEVANAFFKLNGERLLELKVMISKFIDSPSFDEEPYRVLHSLEESTVILPDIICQAAERMFASRETGWWELASRKALAARSIVTLIVRQYEQTTDATIKTKCLDFIDQMEKLGIHGISDELSKIDR